MPRYRIQTHYEKLSEFQRGRIMGLKEAGWAISLVVRVETIWSLEDAGKNGWTMADFSVMMVAVELGQQIGRTDWLSDQLSQSLIHCYQPLDAQPASECSNHADWRRIVFSDEFRFQLCPDDHRRRAFRSPGQRADPACTISRHTVSQPEVMIWEAISFESRTPLVIIRGPLTAQRFVNDILRTVLLAFLLKYPGLIFSKIMPYYIWHVLL
ncbi:transposable element Tc1 transposase [Trichonephila clavipes]|nr:transposable element Tc1 transposase [Trichonephila clavipes]